MTFEEELRELTELFMEKLTADMDIDNPKKRGDSSREVELNKWYHREAKKIAKKHGKYKE